LTRPVASGFRAYFGSPAEGRGEAHGRVNLMGDHTDYNDGFVLPTAIPQKTVVEVARSSDDHMAYSATLDRAVTFGDEGQLPDFARYVGGCLRVLAEEGIELPPVRIWIASTVPVGAGLSSSAALEVATLRAIDDLLGLSTPPVELARRAQRAEIAWAKVAVGIMDQMACALATVDRMLFLDTLTLDYQLLPLPQGSDVVVVDSGVPRELVTSAYNRRRAECREAAEMLDVASLREVRDVTATNRLPSPLRERARHVVSENRRVQQAASATAEEFGRLMNESHASLRDDYAVSTPELDALTEFLRRLPGVFGARLTGAGFGGACVALARKGAGPEIDTAIKAAGHTGWRLVVPAEAA
jgi:galactokinase